MGAGWVLRWGRLRVARGEHRGVCGSMELEGCDPNCSGAARRVAIRGLTCKQPRERQLGRCVPIAPHFESFVANAWEAMGWGSA